MNQRVSRKSKKRQQASAQELELVAAARAAHEARKQRTAEAAKKAAADAAKAAEAEAERLQAQKDAIQAKREAAKVSSSRSLKDKLLGKKKEKSDD